MELVRRAEAVKETKVGAFFGKAGQGQDAASMETAASASLATAAAADAALTMKEATDFFGRAIVVQDKNASGGGGVSSLEMERSKKKTRIWYKFNEGFSNAVKAKVFINELL